PPAERGFEPATTLRPLDDRHRSQPACARPTRHHRRASAEALANHTSHNASTTYRGSHDAPYFRTLLGGLEPQRRVADRDLVAVGQRPFAHPGAVHTGAVRGVEV